MALRLLHDGAQPGPPLPEPLTFGMPDTKGVVHPGTPTPAGLAFPVTLDVTEGAAGQPVLRSPFAHGPPATRFFYLSWKRSGDPPHPWGWRIKIPLAGIGWDQITAAETAGHILTTNVTGRRPHSTDRIVWTTERNAANAKNPLLLGEGRVRV